MDPQHYSNYRLVSVVPQDRQEEGSKVIIDRIPMGVTEAMLRQRLKTFGEPQIHVFMAASAYSKGWAWVSYESANKVEKILEISNKNSTGVEEMLTDVNENGNTIVKKAENTTSEAEVPIDTASYVDESSNGNIPDQKYATDEDNKYPRTCATELEAIEPLQEINNCDKSREESRQRSLSEPDAEESEDSASNLSRSGSETSDIRRKKSVRISTIMDGDSKCAKYSFNTNFHESGDDGTTTGIASCEHTDSESIIGDDETPRGLTNMLPIAA